MSWWLEDGGKIWLLGQLWRRENNDQAHVLQASSQAPGNLPQPIWSECEQTATDLVDIQDLLPNLKEWLLEAGGGRRAKKEKDGGAMRWRRRQSVRRSKIQYDKYNGLSPSIYVA